jgi:hypothetical protein
LAFLAAVALIVLYRLVTGEIDIGQAEMNRLQWLVAAIGFAIYYLSLVVSSPDVGLPDPGVGATAALGGSSLLYVINKLVGLWPAIADAGRAE